MPLAHSLATRPRAAFAPPLPQPTRDSVGSRQVVLLALLANVAMLDMWEHPPAVRFGGQAMVEVAGVLFISSETSRSRYER